MVGFDDIASAAYQNPGLTTVRQPLYEMGQRAADTLVARMERPDEAVPRTISLEPSLVCAARPRARAERTPNLQRQTPNQAVRLHEARCFGLWSLELELELPRRQARAALMNSWHFLTSAIGSSPRYWYSMFTGMSYLFFFTSCSTSLIGVSPSPQGTLSP